jgi:hypothetical protein
MPNSGERADRLPAWSKRVVQDLNVNPNYEAVFWNPGKTYVFKNKQPPKPKSVRVYEAHGKMVVMRDTGSLKIDMCTIDTKQFLSSF